MSKKTEKEFDEIKAEFYKEISKDIEIGKNSMAFY